MVENHIDFEISNIFNNKRKHVAVQQPFKD